MLLTITSSASPATDLGFLLHKKSFMSVALSKVFGTASTGRSKDRPELAERALPLIVDAFEERGVPVVEFISAGGLLKNRFLMQLYADIIGRPIGVIGRRGAVYGRLYGEYSTLHDYYFGRGTTDVMHRLRAIRREAQR